MSDQAIVCPHCGEKLPRVCRECGASKSLDEFERYTRHGKAYRRHICMSCQPPRRRSHRPETPEQRDRRRAATHKAKRLRGQPVRFPTGPLIEWWESLSLYRRGEIGRSDPLVAKHMKEVRTRRGVNTVFLDRVAMAAHEPDLIEQLYPLE